MPSQSTTETRSENTVQLSDSQIVNEHIVNETRFQYLRETLYHDAGQHRAHGYRVRGPSPAAAPRPGIARPTDHLELQNLTTMSAGAQAIKFGMRLRDNRDANSTDADFNGSFNFPSVNSYAAMLNGLAQEARCANCGELHCRRLFPTS